MSRIKKKFIKFGTNSDEVNSRDVPANFTPTYYTPTQIASEGSDKISAHLNGLDSELPNKLNKSTGDINETSFSGAQSAAGASVTNFAFANGSVRGFTATVTVSISATSSLFEIFELKGIQKGSDWEISQTSLGDNTLVDFDINTSGQIIYNSSTYTGFSSMTIKFRALTLSV